MNTIAEPPTFRRGRIGPQDLSRQDHKYISDYAAHYDIPTNLPVDEIVARIFKGAREFIPILPNHTWALNHEGNIILTERRDPPTHPHYLAPTSDPQPNPLGHAFPDLPMDTYSRSPSLAADYDVDAIPSPPPRLPLVYPPVGLPFPVDASGNCPEGTQPVPDDWLEQMLVDYEKDHQTLASDLNALTEETKDVSAEVVRVLGKINAERADTRHLIDAVREICGQDFLDIIMKDVYSTTNFEMNKKRGVSGFTFQSVIYPQGAGDGGKVRSKRVTNDKQIFTAEGGSTALSNQPEDLRAPSHSNNIESTQENPTAITTSSDRLPQSSGQSTKPSKPNTRTNKQKLAAGPSTSSEPKDNTAHAGTSTIVSKGKKRSHPAPTDDTSEPTSRLKRRRKPSVSTEVASSTAPRDGPSIDPATVLPATSTAPSTSTEPPNNEPNTQGRSGTQPLSGDVQNGPSATASLVPPPPFDLWGPRRPPPPPVDRPHRPARIFIPQPLSNINPSVPPTRFPAQVVIPRYTSTTGSANQSSAGPSQQQQPLLAIESAPRRPRPLARNYERLFVDSDGNLEARDYRTPEYLERIAETERSIRVRLQDTQHLVYDSILKRCKERVPAMYYNEEDGDSYELYVNPRPSII